MRAVRRQRGLTLERLAEQTGLTKSYLSKIERRQSTPSIAVALKIARALDVGVGRLFSDEAAEEKITVDRAEDRGGADGPALPGAGIGTPYGDQTITLGIGDSAYFDASVGHKFRAVGAERADVVVVAHAEPRLWSGR